MLLYNKQSKITCIFLFLTFLFLSGCCSTGCNSYNADDNGGNATVSSTGSCSSCGEVTTTCSSCQGTSSCSSCQSASSCSSCGSCNSCLITIPCPAKDCCDVCDNPVAYHPICVPDTCCETKLKGYGMQIVKVGDELLIIIPSDSLFLAQTPVINPDYYCALNTLGRYLKCLNKMNIKIEAYTDATCCEGRALALTRQQAQGIASYLWDRGIDTRLIYGVGYGSENPMATNCTGAGRARNRRIEIHLRLITDCYDH